MSFYTLGKFPSIPSLGIFMLKGYWILLNTFSASVYMILWLHILIIIKIIMTTEKKFNFHSSFPLYFMVIICLSLFLPFHTVDYMNLGPTLDYLYLQYLVNPLIHRSHSIYLCGNDEDEVILQRHLKESG